MIDRNQDSSPNQVFHASAATELSIQYSVKLVALHGRRDRFHNYYIGDSWHKSN
jgi:hypothetical protein